MFIHLLYSLLCVAGSRGVNRYPPVVRPLNSVVPTRFYQSSVNINSLNIDIIAEPDLPPDFDLLVIVRSACEHFQRRDSIRLTWGNVSEYRQGDGGYRVSVIYLVGKSTDATVNNMILAESAANSDLLYADYMDSYANLTIKDILAFQYASKYTSSTNYMAIAGDEIVLDIAGVLNQVTSRDLKGKEEREVTFCYEFPCCTRVVRDSYSKYLVHNGVYEGSLYPPYCSGTFFMLPMALVHQIHHMMLDTPLFMPDDAWLGIVYEKLNISLYDAHSHYAGISSYRKELRLLQHIESGLYYRNRIFVIVLDYAYSNEHVHTKIIELWSAYKSQQNFHSFTAHQSRLYFMYNIYSFLIIILVMVCSLNTTLRRFIVTFWKFLFTFLAVILMYGMCVLTT